MTKEEQSLLLIKEHSNLIKYLLTLGCSFHDSEEIIQTLHERILCGNLNIINYHYFYTAAKNRLISLKRKRKREILTGNNKAFNFISTNHIIHKIGNNNINLTNAIDSLPKKTKAAIKLMFWHNKSRSEIAKELNISVDGVKNLIQRGKKKIREYLVNVNK